MKKIVQGVERMMKKVTKKVQLQPDEYYVQDMTTSASNSHSLRFHSCIHFHCTAAAAEQELPSPSATQTSSDYPSMFAYSHSLASVNLVSAPKNPYGNPNSDQEQRKEVVMAVEA